MDPELVMNQENNTLYQTLEDSLHTKLDRSKYRVNPPTTLRNVFTVMKWYTPLLLVSGIICIGVGFTGSLPFIALGCIGLVLFFIGAYIIYRRYGFIKVWLHDQSFGYNVIKVSHSENNTHMGTYRILYSGNKLYTIQKETHDGKDWDGNYTVVNGAIIESTQMLT